MRLRQLSDVTYFHAHQIAAYTKEKQAEFIEYYEQLKSTLAPDERLLFMDAVHPTQATKITASWIIKGEDKAVKTTDSRSSINIVGAIELDHFSLENFTLMSFYLTTGHKQKYISYSIFNLIMSITCLLRL